MRTNSKWFISVTAAIFIAAGCQSASAAFIGLPNMLGQAAKRISFGNFTLPPMAYTRFCLRYADQCKAQRITFRGGPVRLTAARWDDLREINRHVNSAIVPQRQTEGPAFEKWLINPTRGDCNDYAVSKRAELLARGWPARALLLSEVRTAWGEGHLILVVRTSVGDLVLDSLTPQIRQWTRAPYTWVRMQTPTNPNYWAAPGEVRTTLMREANL
jgi:predicted transglutaminase-like cysteine proteinase